MQGVDDGYGTMAQVEAIARCSGGPVQLEKLEDCGHDPFRDQPRRTLDLCAAFIARHAESPGR
jgi:pimeloyl-ACP methyl ester carboxylesterase